MQKTNSKDKKTDYRHAKDRGDSPRIKLGVDKLKDPTYLRNFSKNELLLDRGDSRKPKNYDLELKYNASKNNKVIEENLKFIKAITDERNNKDGARMKNINKLHTGSRYSNGFAEQETKPRLSINSKPVERKITESKPSEMKSAFLKSDRKLDGITDADRKKTKIKEVITIPYKPANYLLVQEPNEDLPVQRKPIIKSNTTKNCTSKVPKAVSFREGTPSIFSNKTGKTDIKARSLDANIKTQSVRSKTKVLNTVKVSKRRKKKDNSQSPNKSDANELPPAVIAKWEPSCLTSQTRPYYAAWVNTTLTAVSKCSEKDQDLIRLLQNSKRPVSPELFENFDDERYMGRIRVRHRLR